MKYFTVLTGIEASNRIFTGMTFSSATVITFVHKVNVMDKRMESISLLAKIACVIKVYLYRATNEITFTTYEWNAPLKMMKYSGVAFFSQV